MYCTTQLSEITFVTFDRTQFFPYPKDNMKERPYQIVIHGPDKSLVMRDLLRHDLSFSELQAILIALTNVPTMFLDETKSIDFNESLLKLEKSVKE